jgi:hypothetical protein
VGTSRQRPGRLPWTVKRDSARTRFAGASDCLVAEGGGRMPLAPMKTPPGFSIGRNGRRNRDENAARRPPGLPWLPPLPGASSRSISGLAGSALFCGDLTISRARRILQGVVFNAAPRTTHEVPEGFFSSFRRSYSPQGFRGGPRLEAEASGVWFAVGGSSAAEAPRRFRAPCFRLLL